MLVVGTVSSSSRVPTSWQYVSSSLQWDQVSTTFTWESLTKL